MESEIRQVVMSVDNPVNAADRAEKGVQHRRRFNNDRRAVFRDKRRIANELYRIAKALFAVKQDCLARYMPLTDPLWLLEITRGGGEVLLFPTPFPQAPAGLEITLQK